MIGFLNIFESNPKALEDLKKRSIVAYNLLHAYSVVMDMDLADDIYKDTNGLHVRSLRPWGHIWIGFWYRDDYYTVDHTYRGMDTFMVDIIALDLDDESQGHSLNHDFRHDEITGIAKVPAYVKSVIDSWYDDDDDEEEWVDPDPVGSPSKKLATV